jgi:small-conductance mechanosensitive channel
MKSLVIAAKCPATLVAVLAIACLCGNPYAAAQVESAPAQPPSSAPAANAKKSAEAKADKPETQKKPATAREALQKFWSLSLTDLLDWLRLHGLFVVLILALAFGILSLANRLHNRLVRIVADLADRGSPADQENRARTLVGVLHNALRTVVIAVAVIMVLEQIGLHIGPLIGGVAVAGLAVAFGAQSLIKDYFTGFLVLLEQQYMIGDMVKIGAITGQVEKITLRLTVLRDAEGSVHFIPHGQITVVSNLTHEWSQALFDLNVISGEQPDRVRNLFFELVGELRKDPTFGPMILADPEMLGVDSLGDATFTMKFALRTQPLKRWQVKRELLRRIKERFQREQIKVSVPA